MSPKGTSVEGLVPGLGQCSEMREPLGAEAWWKEVR